MLSLKEKIENSFDVLVKEFKYKHKMEAPKIEKIVVSVGVGKYKDDKRKLSVIQDRISKITGQKATYLLAKKSIASFKLRQGQVVGYKVTLYGKKMIMFFDKFISIIIPRMRDFRGISNNSVDEMGNLTIGIKEHIIFPETGDEEIKDIFGLSITVVSSASSKKEGLAFFKHLGIPFKKIKK
ncbi:MAG: 50S ribosomal protein L5 [Candidatus Pacebacteria bacterium]|nr:50S ribosomal protein L5 [Candidatus Paceibacterota bacterium]